MEQTLRQQASSPRQANHGVGAVTRRRIEFVELEHLTTWELQGDAFGLTPERGWVWLQKLCIWVLRKLGCFYNKPEVEIKRHIIAPDDFMERFFKQSNALEDLRMRPAAILVGAEDYRDLMQSSLANEAFSFPARYGHGGQICGLEVIVLPTIRGMVVLPELNSVRRAA